MTSPAETGTGAIGSAERGGAGDDPRTRSPLLFTLQVCALWTIAVTQPLFEVLGRDATFFVARRASSAQILTFAILTALLVPCVLGAAPVVLRRLGPSTEGRTRLVVIGGLGALAGLPPLSRLVPLNRATTVVAALALLALIGLAYSRFRGLRLLLTWAALGLPIALFTFIFATPVRGLVFPQVVESVSAVRAASETPVVMVVLDELPVSSIMGPDGMIDEARFPALAELAGSATWYRSATTVHRLTHHAVPAILTGIQPAGDAIPTRASHPRNLFSLLARSHRLDVHEALTRLCDFDPCGDAAAATGEGGSNLLSLYRDVGVIYGHVALPASWDRHLPSIDDRWGGFLGDDTRLEGEALDELQERADADVALDQVDRFRRFIDGIEAEERPTLHYLHVLLPHRPWLLTPTGQRYGAPSDLVGVVNGRWGSDVFLVHQALQRHLLQMRFTDRLIGELIDRLRSADLFDRALIVLIADHGIGFEPGVTLRGVAGPNHDQILNVPMLLKAPGQREGVVDDRNFQLIDVLPTMVDVLGIDLPWDADGLSGLGPPRTGVRRTLSGDGGGGKISVRLQTTLDRASEHGRLFPKLRPDYDLYGFGEYAQLVGEQTEDFLRVAAAPRLAIVDGPGSSLTVRDGSPWPGWVEARVVGLRPGDAASVAVGVDGVIAAVGETYSDAGADGMLSLLLPEAVLDEGTHDLEFFLIQGGAANPSLHPIGVR